jgi:hypothetical protein
MARVLGGLMISLLALGLAATARAEGRWQQVENQDNCAVWNANSKKTSKITWTGACVNGKASGAGAMIWRYSLPDLPKPYRGMQFEDTYTGTMQNGKRHGRGVNANGKGIYYEGDWKDGKEHGRGIYNYGRYIRYEGDWKDGKMHGRGVMVQREKHIKYDGDWKDNKPHGHGVVVSANGDSCEGDWHKGKQQGTGEAWVNGQKTKCYIDGELIEFKD